MEPHSEPRSKTKATTDTMPRISKTLAVIKMYGRSGRPPSGVPGGVPPLLLVTGTAVAVEVGVWSAAVALGITVTVPVACGVAVRLGVGVMTGAVVGVGVGVLVGVGVGVLVGVGVGEGEGGGGVKVGVKVGVRVGVPGGSAVAVSTRSSVPALTWVITPRGPASENSSSSRLDAAAIILEVMFALPEPLLMVA